MWHKHPIRMPPKASVPWDVSYIVGLFTHTDISIIKITVHSVSVSHGKIVNCRLNIKIFLNMNYYSKFENVHFLSVSSPNSRNRWKNDLEYYFSGNKFKFPSMIHLLPRPGFFFQMGQNVPDSNIIVSEFKLLSSYCV